MHIWKKIMNGLKMFLSLFVNSALQVGESFFFPHFHIYMSTYLNIITNIKLNNLGNARINRMLVEAPRYMPEDRGFDSR